MAEGGGLLNRYTVLKPYLGFESPPLRQIVKTDPGRHRADRGLFFRRIRTMWYVYILRCSDASLYTGVTNDLARRLKAHNAGRGAKYTRSRLPVALVHVERKRAKGNALAREARIKRLPRQAKLALLAG